MAKDPAILQIELMFSSLNTPAAADSFPQPNSLSDELIRVIDFTKDDYTEIVHQKTVRKFATAAVEMWHRSIHSFLISSSLTKSSPLWSSVSGYYSSHYTMRAFAHLLGHFQLYKRKRIIQLEIDGKNYYCNISTKKGGEREHRLCWKIVKKHSAFANNPFFTINDDNLPESDGAHRNKANYQDHIGRFPKFQPLNEAYLKSRIELISNMELSDAPIPNVESYPDLDNVQLVAYHRLVQFRAFLDEILGGSNRFWNANRKPDWCPTYLDFQLVEPQFASLYKDVS